MRCCRVASAAALPPSPAAQVAVPLFRLHAMGTSPGGLDRGHPAPRRRAARKSDFELGLPRVYSVLKLDERRDREQTLDDKVASVERLLEG